MEPIDYSGAGGVELDVNAGTYALSESAGPAGYAAGSLRLRTAPGRRCALGESKTCTINNNDKHRASDAGQDGDQRQRRHCCDYRLDADGGRYRRLSPGAGGFDLDVNAGTYALSESAGPAGYTAGSFDCGRAG